MLINTYEEAIEIAVKNNWKQWCGGRTFSDVSGVALTENGVVLYLSLDTTSDGIFVTPFKARVSDDGVILHDWVYGRTTVDPISKDHAIGLYNARVTDRITTYLWKEDVS